MRIRTSTGLTLLGRFTVASALIAASFALALGWLIAREVTRATFDEAVTTTALVADSLLSPYLVRGDFVYPLWPGRLDDLDRLIGRHLTDRGIVRVNLWKRDGVVIYSNDRQLVGRRFGLSEELQAALDGRVAAELASLSKDEDEWERAYSQLLDVYVPVRLMGMSRPEGVYEIYRDARPLLAKIRAARIRAWGLVFVGTAILYGSLFGLVRRASTALVKQQEALQEAFEGTIRSLATAVDARDTYTGSHSSQVSHYAEVIARTLGLPEEDVQVVRIAGYLHDLGKIGIPDSLLRKTGTLSEQEWATIRLHSHIGFRILEPVPVDERVKLAVRHNHERWDGTGYPDGLAKEAIPLHARILMVADAFEAMTSTRPYRSELGVTEAVEELRRQAGTQFDPRVAEACLRALDRQREDAPAKHALVESLRQGV